MARLLKYRFDLLKPGESLLCEGAMESDVARRAAGYAARLASRPTEGDEERCIPVYVVRAVAAGCEIERVS